MRGDHVTTFRAASSEPIPVARFSRVRFEEAPRPAAFHLTHVGIMKRAPMRSLHCFHLSFPGHHFLAPKIFSVCFPVVSGSSSGPITSDMLHWRYFAMPRRDPSALVLNANTKSQSHLTTVVGYQRRRRYRNKYATPAQHNTHLSQGQQCCETKPLGMIGHFSNSPQCIFAPYRFLACIKFIHQLDVSLFHQAGTVDKRIKPYPPPPTISRAGF